ncbi:YbaB/EbfC DNA-binding family protein [Actinopolyspora xinjiangensis]|uniref:YbaB/EbfC DNA-binding family protein n=1 Tax=Actinopolyspora xinjiangensis TaxID=405564 RepID=A0A1H0NDR4_9ACTN|nr:YbaB/EbfC family nucleoid-associated protein [Actinopolyspora xinjiangensis]SDO90872.1 YbaB/EbfC DNA-binding family protein [Actinopolyspora xinjiangensis]
MALIDHRAQVDEMIADYRRSRQRLSEVGDELAAIEETVGDERGTVSVTVGSGGALRRLWLSEQAYRTHRPEELGRLIVRLSGTATERVAERTDAVLATVLPSGSDPAAFRAEVAPPPVTGVSVPRGSGRADNDPETSPAEPEQEESPEPRSWLRDVGAAERSR